jgi:hypothetical protein
MMSYGIATNKHKKPPRPITQAVYGEEKQTVIDV